MNSASKHDFLERLRRELSALPAVEVEKSLSFYEEMIDDRVENGEPESDAVAALGDPATVARTIIAELPAIPKAIAKSKTKSPTANWILAVVLSPLWVPLAIAAIAVVFAAYVIIWSLALSVWLLAIGLMCGAPIGLVAAVYCLFIGEPVVAVYQLGAGLVCFGLGMFCLTGAKKASAWFADLSRRYLLKVQSWFVKNAEANDNATKERAYAAR